jgi:hypothetical protein
MKHKDWDIRNNGRDWKPEEALQRLRLIPAKAEMFNGKLLWSMRAKVNVLALLLELVGADRAVRLGDPEVWRRAVAKLDLS